MSDTEGPPPIDDVDDEPTEIDLGNDGADGAESDKEEEVEETPSKEEEEEVSLDEPEEEEEEEVKEQEQEEEEAVEEPKEEEKEEEPVEEEVEEPVEEEKPVKKEVESPKKESPKKAAPSKSPTPSSATTKSPLIENTNYVFNVKITDTEKIGDGMSSYFVYKIEAKTNVAEYKSKDMVVSRRFSDFHTLMKVLIAKYPGIIIPPCPPKDAVGTLVGKQKDIGTKFIERRQKSLERFLKRLVGHPTLVADEIVRMFFETDAKMPAPAKSGATLMSKMSMYFETDEYFDDRWKQAEILESQLKRLNKGIEGLHLARRGLAITSTTFAERFAALADAEELKQLTKTMHQLADVEAKVAKFHNKQAMRDYYDFAENIFDYIHLVGACKTAMVQRQEVNKIYIASTVNLETKSKRETKIKADPKASAIPEKVDAAIAETKEAQEKVKQAKKNVVTISKSLRRELERFDFVKIQEFQKYCVEYIESVMNMEHQICKAWESFLPEAKSLQV